METWQVTLIVGAASLLGTLVGAAIGFLTNWQRLRAEERRFWRERILEHASRIMLMSTELARVSGDDVNEMVKAAQASIQALESELMPFQFIAPERLMRIAARLHLFAMGYGLQMATAGTAEGGNK